MPPSENSPPTQTQLVDLLASMASLSARIDGHRKELERMNFRSRMLTIVAVLLGVALVVVGVVGAETRHTAQVNSEVLAASNRDRAERTTVGCIRDNIAIAGQRAAMAATATGAILVFAPDPEHLTDQQQALFDRYTEAAQDSAAAALPYRDCSPQGIDDYFATTPIDPAATTTVAG